jgi:hypothetical protein
VPGGKKHHDGTDRYLFNIPAAATAKAGGLLIELRSSSKLKLAEVWLTKSE